MTTPTLPVIVEEPATTTSHEPISVMKAYFSVINKDPEWNKLMPPLQKIDHPSSNKIVINLYCFKYLTIMSRQYLVFPLK